MICSKDEQDQSDWIEVTTKSKKKKTQTTDANAPQQRTLEENINEYNHILQCLTELCVEKRLSYLKYLTANPICVDRSLIISSAQANGRSLLLRRPDSKTKIITINNIKVHSTLNDGVETCVSFSKTFNKNLEFAELDEVSLRAKKSQWENVQIELKKHQIHEDDPVLGNDFESLKLIAGMDISFHVERSVACAGVCVFEISNKKLKLVYSHCHYVNLDVQFVTSYLVFREYNSYMELFSLIPANKRPQLVCFDGNGVFHDLEFGMACHVGVLNDIVSIGVSKSFTSSVQYKFRTLPRFETDLDILNFVEGKMKKFESFPIQTSNKNEIMAYVYVNSDDLFPVYVSRGNKISNQTSINFIKFLCRLETQTPSKIPLLTDQADKITRKAIRNLDSNYSLFQ